MDSKNFNLLLAGVGGQGIIFAGQVVMDSALRQGYQVFGFEEHGMARRGGAVASHIRFGDKAHTPLVPVGFGKLLVALEPAEALRHVHYLDPESVIILNTKPVVPNSVSSGGGSYPALNEIIDVLMTRSRELYSINASALAQEAGNPITLNVVMLGAIAASEAVDLPKEVVLEIIKMRSPSHSMDINIKAFELGYKEIEEGK
jgi:indolepyruvate ferredoxin oxidoreductase beta subunit